MDLKEILKKIPPHIIAFFRGQQLTEFFYHNLEHTLYVVEAAQEIGKHEKLNLNGRFVIESAAWFYDTGFLTGNGNCEAASAELAMAFLQHENVEEDLVKEVMSLIMTTQLRHKPGGFLEGIICDAVFFHLGGTSFSSRNKYLRKETVALRQRWISEKEWIAETIRFMEAHQYCTAYACRELNNGKAENLKILKSRLHDLQLT